MVVQLKHPKNFYNLLAVVKELSSDVLNYLDDYENYIYDNYELKKRLKNIEFVYMHYILITLSKLFSISQNDKSGMKSLKLVSPMNIQKEFQELEDKNKDLFEKIKSNRHRMIVHIDISEEKSFHKMGFSKLQMDKMIEDYVSSMRYAGKEEIANTSHIFEDMRRLEAKENKEERYSPLDFYRDIGRFREITKKLSSLADKVNQHYYEISFKS